MQQALSKLRLGGLALQALPKSCCKNSFRTSAQAISTLAMCIHPALTPEISPGDPSSAQARQHWEQAFRCVLRASGRVLLYQASPCFLHAIKVDLVLE